MPSRGLTKQTNLSAIQDSAVRESLRQMESRMLNIEKRIAVPDEVTAGAVYPLSAVVATGAIQTFTLNELTNVRIQTDGGLVCGFFRTHPDAPNDDGVGTYLANIRFVSLAGATAGGVVRIKRNNRVIKNFRTAIAVAGAIGTDVSMPIESCFFIDRPAPGENAYSVEFLIYANTGMIYQYFQLVLLKLLPISR